MKGLDFVIKKTANDLNLPEEQVKILVTSYWSKVYKGVTMVKGQGFFIREVGTFTISRHKLRVFIRKRIAKIRFILNGPLTGERRQKRLDTHYKKLRIALHYRNELAKQYSK